MRRFASYTALRPASYFGTTAKFWLGLQDDFDIEEEMESKNDVFERIEGNSPQNVV